MMLRTLLVLAAIFAGAPSAWAHNGGGDSDDCDARLQHVPRVTATFADPLSVDTAIEPFTLRLRDISDPGCRFSISFEDDQGRDGLRRQGGNRRLDYRIALDAAGASVVYDSNRPNSPFGAAAMFGLDGRLTLYLIVELGSGARAGEYAEEIRAELRPLGDRRDVDDMELDLAADVPAHVQAFLAGVPGSGGAYMLDLEELTTGESGTATLRILATSDVDISFESENDGRLVHEDEISAVPYELNVGSQQETVIAGGAGHRNGRGRGHYSHGNGHGHGHHEQDGPLSIDLPLEVRIGDVARSAAGDYHDRITITVSAR